MVQAVKASAYNVGDRGSIPGVGRPPGEGMAAHSSILAWKIPWTAGGAWQATVHGVAKSQTRLSNFTSLHFKDMFISEAYCKITKFKFSIRVKIIDGAVLKNLPI